eukprot:PhF_6_TR41709/c0_g1_i1/m.63278/K01669/phrB; deoxyribodipyrimidine photo-lyase
MKRSVCILCVLSRPTKPPAKNNNVMFWFSGNDFRLHDNYPLTMACKKAFEIGGSVYPVVVVDPRLYAGASSVCGFFRSHPRRARFLIDCIEDIRNSLMMIHQCPLWIRVGKPEVIIPQLAKQYQCGEVYTQEMHAPLEARVQASIQKSFLETGDSTLRTVWGSTLLHPDDLPFPTTEFPLEFWKYWDVLESSNLRPTFPFDCRRRGCLPTPILENTDECGEIPTIRDFGYKDPLNQYEKQTDGRQVSTFQGGETQGCAFFQEYLETNGIVYMSSTRTRKNTQLSKLYGNMKASRISAWVTHGCISPRRMYELVRKYSIDNNGTFDWQCQHMMRNLAMRDYWHFISKRFGKSLFQLRGPTPDTTTLDHSENLWRYDDMIIRRWCKGVTGTPFIDACARELAQTGYITHEARQALLWYLSIGLQQDWRVAAEWFERNLIDYDPHVCWGNCVYFSGLMFVLGGPKIHSSEWLASQHDTAGRYTRLWVPELHNVPTYFIHRVQAMTPRMQTMHKARLGIDYPHPIKLWVGANQDPEVMKSLKSYVDDSEHSAIGEGVRYGVGLEPGRSKPLLMA